MLGVGEAGPVSLSMPELTMSSNFLMRGDVVQQEWSTCAEGIDETTMFIIKLTTPYIYRASIAGRGSACHRRCTG